MIRWLDLPIDSSRAGGVPTWGAVAERYDRCLGRLAFYVGRRVDGRAAAEFIVDEALRQNPDLLVGPHDELGEFRRLKESADHLIETVGRGPAPSRGARP